MTPQQRWLRWFGNHSVEWLQTRVEVTGIHNYLTNRTFTAFEKATLANGLRFIPTPSIRLKKIFESQYLAADNSGLPRLHRTLSNRHLYPPNDAQRVSKFIIPHRGKVSAAPIHDSIELRLIEAYRRGTERALRIAIANARLNERVNCHRDDLTFIHRLIDDPDITCKPADKNLGLVLVDTKWYDDELQRMLRDRVTYAPFNQSVPQLMNRLATELRELVMKWSSTLETWQPTLFPQLERFMSHKVSAKERAIPNIYLLLKVHKKVLCGRPIVPCTKWITTPASILVDYLLQEILAADPIPWLVKDTKSFVNELERTHLVDRDGSFVTADIASLYTNIDTQLGLKLIDEFLTERHIPSSQRRLVMALLEFVMNNSYLAFKGQVYHQIDGTAMGTSCAPTYANIIVYMLERTVVAELAGGIRLYRRFLDDVFAYLTESCVEEFQIRMNSLHAKLKFEFVRHPTEAAFLDLHIHKGDRFHTDGRFDLRVHQKKMNLYLYIPYLSMHTDAAKRSFIQTELMRYIRNSSSRQDYLDLRQLFFRRLLDRGYPRDFLAPVFTSIRYADRSLMLIDARDLASHPLRFAHPPLSTCLIKRLARVDRATLVASVDHRDGPARPPVFVIPFTPLSRAIPTRNILMAEWPLLRSVIQGLPPPIIAYQSYPSFLSLLIHRKAKLAEEKRKGPPQLKLIQSHLPFRRSLPHSTTITSQHPINHDGPVDMDVCSQ